MLEFKVADGSFFIKRHPFIEGVFYIHFVENGERDNGIQFIGKLTACIIYCQERQIEYIEREIETLKSLVDPIVYTEEE